MSLTGTKSRMLRRMVAAIMASMVLSACATNPKSPDTVEQQAAKAHALSNVATIVALETGKVSLSDTNAFIAVITPIRDGYASGSLDQIVFDAILTQIAGEVSPSLVALVQLVLAEIDVDIDTPGFDPDPVTLASLSGVVDGATTWAATATDE